MESKTPKFDKAINKILSDLTPAKKLCLWSDKNPHCEGKFEITAEDIEFLKKFKVPAPNFCPTCRKIKRLTHFNLMQLCKRKCDAPNHEETMISIYPEECPFPVYDYHYFISDDFDPFSFGKEYKEGEVNMDFLLKLRKEFPVPSFLNKNPNDVNSDYSNGGRDLKNGYYVMACYHVEDAWYSLMINKSRQVMDSYTVMDSEFVYSSVASDHLYKTSFAYFSNNCTDSMFLFNCRNCTSCFGCVNLRNAKYQIFNEQYSKEDYGEFIESIHPLSRTSLNEIKNKFWELVRSLPMNGTRNLNSHNVTGVNITNSQNIFSATDVHDSENIRHCDGALSHKDSMDFLYSGGNSHNLYMDVNIGSQSSNVKFSVASKFSSDSEFIFNSKNLNNCFMCFGLQNKSYCILNKQYSENKYWKIVDEIKTNMLENGEYGDGLGLEFSPQAYNFSIAQVQYPLTDEKVKDLGGYTAPVPETNVGNLEVLKASSLPETIDEIDNSILDKAIECEVTERPFRITKSELSFLKENGLPLPTTHPSVRIENNWRLSPVGRSYKDNCAKCGKDIRTLFTPENKFILYCESCYQKEIY